MKSFTWNTWTFVAHVLIAFACITVIKNSIEIKSLETRIAALEAALDKLTGEK